MATESAAAATRKPAVIDTPDAPQVRVPLLRPVVAMHK